MTDNVTPLPSIQGEDSRLWPATAEVLTDSEVDEYVDSHSDGVNLCRMKVRHDFPEYPPNRIPWSHIDRDGLYVTPAQRCARCLCAWRVQYYEAIRRTSGDLRWEKVGQDVTYRRGPNGESYLMAPGHGRLPPRRVESSVMTGLVKQAREENGETIAAMNKRLKRAGKRIEREEQRQRDQGTAAPSASSA